MLYIYTDMLNIYIYIFNMYYKRLTHKLFFKYTQIRLVTVITHNYNGPQTGLVATCSVQTQPASRWHGLCEGIVGDIYGASV